MFKTIKRIVYLLSLVLLLTAVSNAYLDANQIKLDPERAGLLRKSLVFLNGIDLSLENGFFQVALKTQGSEVPVFSTDMNDLLLESSRTPNALLLICLTSLWVFMPAIKTTGRKIAWARKIQGSARIKKAMLES